MEVKPVWKNPVSHARRCRPNRAALPCTPTYSRSGPVLNALCGLCARHGPAAVDGSTRQTLQLQHR
jgi:hypothetical protein